MDSWAFNGAMQLNSNSRDGRVAISARAPPFSKHSQTSQTNTASGASRLLSAPRLTLRGSTSKPQKRMLQFQLDDDWIICAGVTPSLFPTHGDLKGALHEGGDLSTPSCIPLSELPPSQSVLPTGLQRPKVYGEPPPRNFPSLRPTLPCSALLLRLCTLVLLLGSARAACPGGAAPGYHCVGTAETLCQAGKYCTGGAAPAIPCLTPANCAGVGLSVEPPCVWNVTALAGNGGTTFANGQGAAATFNSPQGVATDASGVVYVGDAVNQPPHQGSDPLWPCEHPRREWGRHVH